MKERTSLFNKLKPNQFLIFKDQIITSQQHHWIKCNVLKEDKMLIWSLILSIGLVVKEKLLFQVEIARSRSRATLKSKTTGTDIIGSRNEEDVSDNLILNLFAKTLSSSFWTLPESLTFPLFSWGAAKSYFISLMESSVAEVAGIICNLIKSSSLPKTMTTPAPW